MLLPRSTGLAYIVKELKEWEEKTGEVAYLYDTTMQFEGYSGEIAANDYTRVVDVNYPDPNNSVWKVRQEGDCSFIENSYYLPSSRQGHSSYQHCQ